VALKTAAEDVAHKAGAGGVRLGLTSDEEVEAAYDELAGRLGPAVTMAEMAPPGVEVALGVYRDADFGPLVMVAAGGVLVEVLNDRALGLPPLDEARAVRLVERLQLSRVLPAGPQSVAKALVALSVLALDLPFEVVAVDVNPVIVYSRGCVAVDVLVERDPGSA
jgi:hypothetical protein